MVDRPTLVLISGIPGAGKSTLARRLARRTSLPVIDRDDFKDALFETLGWSDRVWSQRVGGASFVLTFLMIRRLLESGTSLIAETNFSRRELPNLEPIRTEIDAHWLEVFCTADLTVCADRMYERSTRGGRHPGHNPEASSADDYLSLLTSRGEWAPVGIADRTITVDTTTEQPDLAQILDALATLPQA